MSSPITSSTAGTANTTNFFSNDIAKNSQQMDTEKKGSIFGRVLTWFSDLFSHKASNETKECFLVAIFKSISSYINPWHNTTVKTASAQEGNREDRTRTEAAIHSHKTNKSNSSQQDDARLVITEELQLFSLKNNEESSTPAPVMNDAVITLTSTAQQPLPSTSNQPNSPLPAQVTNSVEKEVGNTPKQLTLTEQIKKLEKEIKQIQNYFKTTYTTLLEHKNNHTLQREKEKDYLIAKAEADKKIQTKQKQLQDLQTAKQAERKEMQQQNGTPTKKGTPNKSRRMRHTNIINQQIFANTEGC